MLMQIFVIYHFVKKKKKSVKVRGLKFFVIFWFIFHDFFFSKNHFLLHFSPTLKREREERKKKNTFYWVLFDEIWKIKISKIWKCWSFYFLFLFKFTILFFFFKPNILFSFFASVDFGKCYFTIQVSKVANTCRLKSSNKCYFLFSIRQAKIKKKKENRQKLVSPT